MSFRLHKLALLAIFTLIWGTMASAMATANTVPPSKASNTSFAITANTLKPTECAGITLTAKISGSGTISGTGAAELIVGGPGADTINAGGGTDCVLGGGGNDNLNGQGGDDVIIGGAGADNINGGAGGGDVCYQNGGGGSFAGCEMTNP
jgi:Ca2+-binding RTX toxin-like protein